MGAETITKELHGEQDLVFKNAKRCSSLLREHTYILLMEPGEHLLQKKRQSCICWALFQANILCKADYIAFQQSIFDHFFVPPVVQEGISLLIDAPQYDYA